MEDARITPGSLMLRLGQVFTGINASHDVVPSQYEPGVPEELQAARHVLDILFYQTQLVAELQVMNRLSVGVEIPFRATGIEATFTNPDGQELSTFSSIHHRDEWIVGLADPVVRVGTQLLRPGDWGRTSLTLQLGASLPVGNTEDDPFRLGEEGLEHQHMFFGYGSIVPQLALHWNVQFDEWKVGGWGNGRLGLFNNEYGYTPGSGFQTALGIQSGFGTSSFWGGMEGRYLLETPAQWESREAENSGRSVLSVALLGGWSFSPSWSVSLDVSRSVVELDVAGDQLEMPWIAGASVGWNGRLWED